MAEAEARRQLLLSALRRWRARAAGRAVSTRLASREARPLLESASTEREESQSKAIASFAELNSPLSQTEHPRAVRPCAPLPPPPEGAPRHRLWSPCASSSGESGRRRPTRPGSAPRASAHGSSLSGAAAWADATRFRGRAATPTSACVSSTAPWVGHVGERRTPPRCDGVTGWDVPGSLPPPRPHEWAARLEPDVRAPDEPVVRTAVPHTLPLGPNVPLSSARHGASAAPLQGPSLDEGRRLSTSWGEAPAGAPHNAPPGDSVVLATEQGVVSPAVSGARIHSASWLGCYDEQAIVQARVWADRRTLARLDANIEVRPARAGEAVQLVAAELGGDAKGVRPGTVSARCAPPPLESGRVAAVFARARAAELSAEAEAARTAHRRQRGVVNGEVAAAIHEAVAHEAATPLLATGNAAGESAAPSPNNQPASVEHPGATPSLKQLESSPAEVATAGALAAAAAAQAAAAEARELIANEGRAVLRRALDIWRGSVLLRRWERQAAHATRLRFVSTRTRQRLLELQRTRRVGLKSARHRLSHQRSPPPLG